VYDTYPLDRVVQKSVSAETMILGAVFNEHV